MTIYTDILCLAAVVVFIVDLSGWTSTWKGWLATWLGVKVGSCRPFDCSLCMTHHVCLLYAIIAGQFSLAVWAFICLVAALTKPMAAALNAARYALEALIAIINTAIDKLWLK